VAFDGSGNYTLTYTFATEAASPPIAISKLDTELSGIATGLSLAILRNGNGKPTANIDWNAKKLTNLADATAATDAMNRQAGDARWAQLGAANTFTAAINGTDLLMSGDVTGKNLLATGTAPYLLVTESDAAANNGKWMFLATGEAFYLYAEDDALSSGGAAVTINRTGTTVDSIALAATAITLNGGTAWHSGNDGSGSGLDADLLDAHQATDFVLASTVESGTFTAYLRATDGGANLNSGTATWKKHNGVVTLLLPSLTTSTSDTTLLIDELPTAIRSTSHIYLTCHGYVDGAQSTLRVQVVANQDYLYLTTVTAGAFASSTTTKGVLPTVLTWVV